MLSPDSPAFEISNLEHASLFRPLPAQECHPRARRGPRFGFRAWSFL